MILPGEIFKWPAEWLELWNERVAIMFYEGKMSERVAKYEAEKDIRKIAMEYRG